MNQNYISRSLGIIGSLFTVGLTTVTVAAQAQPAYESGKAANSSTQSAGKGAIQNVPRLLEKGTMTVTGTENWEEMTASAKNRAWLR